MSSIPYDWSFNANNSGQSSIPGVLVSDTQGNVTITGKLSTDGGMVSTNGSGVLTASSFMGDITNTTAKYENSTYTDPTDQYTNVMIGDIIKDLNFIVGDFDDSYYYNSKLRADNSQINSDGNGTLSINNLDVGNQKSTSLDLTITTYDDSPIGNTTINLETNFVMSESWTYYVTGTGIPENTTITSITEETDTTTNTIYYKIVISNALTADLPSSSSVVVTSLSNITNISFYTSGNTTSNIGIKITGESNSTSTTTNITLDKVIFTSTSLSFDGNTVLFSNLPTSDPKVINQLWVNGGILMVSQG